MTQVFNMFMSLKTNIYGNHYGGTNTLYGWSSTSYGVPNASYRFPSTSYVGETLPMKAHHILTYMSSFMLRTKYQYSIEKPQKK
jgi:hypothetical protein